MTNKSYLLQIGNLIRRGQLAFGRSHELFGVSSFNGPVVLQGDAFAGLALNAAFEKAIVFVLSEYGLLQVG